MPMRPKVHRAPQSTAPVHRAPQSKRPAWANKLYGRRWKKLAKVHLDANPLCVECSKAGLTVGATCVDHVVPHKGDETLFYDESNLRSLCARCHNRATARYDGGFGRPVTPKPTA